MKRIFLALSILLFTGLAGAFVLSPQRAAAVDVLNGVCENSKHGTPDVCKDNKGSSTNPLFGKKGILTKAVSILARVVGIIAVIAIIIAGFMMITSDGDSSKVATARRSLVYALAGLAIAVTAQLIVAFILNSL